ncbi:glutathione peroxidase [Aerococcus sp. UMB8608]|uniref:Glutathione peroxidase n=1 Tax=Aerococcus sanguinicola TaxID=119206 RepID=A0A5N1GJ29_9LACT|nr:MULTISPECIES: glutathione peroxidase [Aerococcus]KAA9300318.1 glutathione peroxidase [Aerococcus sanguinicola]MDK6369879.1 glutathione peroxidase [Aerococcus sp. UMB9870]MDK6678845.1 glutathione peroxidase [Aerococcus sp. UMB8608]MDK6686837.1 glutathione peroxidase [Aerococcus sp. UMB8623]MDK6939503.1 glutathione peroxidase [Aerococcus sp. UMB8487]
MTIYDYAVERPDGTYLDLADLKGKVILIVNTATRCGFTSQYKELQKLYHNYHDQGLEIIDIPCNQFRDQAPETDQEIQAFCQLNFQTEFPQMKKAKVNGPDQLDLYRYLKSQQAFQGFGKSAKGLALAAMMKVQDSQYQKNPDIKWNFTKFLVDRHGQVVARYEPTHSLNKLSQHIESLL